MLSGFTSKCTKFIVCIVARDYFNSMSVLPYSYIIFVWQYYMQNYIQFSYTTMSNPKFLVNLGPIYKADNKQFIEYYFNT